MPKARRAAAWIYTAWGRTQELTDRLPSYLVRQAYDLEQRKGI